MTDDDDPREIATGAEHLADELHDGETEEGLEDDGLDDEEIELHEQLGRDRKELVDVDEREADDLLLLDRKELNELGLELDNPDGFAEE